MNKSQELYQEEQRQKLIELHESIKELSTLLKQQVDQYTPPPKEMEVKGEVEVSNPQSQVNVENLGEVVQSVHSLEQTLSKSIEDNSYEPPEEVSVKNIEGSKPETIKVENLSDLKSYFDNLKQSIENNQPVVEVEKQEVEFPKSASEAVPVRLSDGQSFYKAMMSASSGALSFKDQNNKGAQAQLDSKGRVPVSTGTFSPFSEIVTAERTSIINLSSVYPLSTLRNITSGTVNFSGAEYEVTGGAKLESAEIGRYVPGYAAEVGVGIRLATLPTTATWGYYDSDNGMQWKIDGDLQAVLKRNGTDQEIINRVDFNVDPLDGTGPSGIRWGVNTDLIYQIMFTWYGYGQIEWQIVGVNNGRQEVYPVHRLEVEGSTSIFSPNLPITAESTGGSIFVAGRQMSILGKYRPPQRVTSARQTSKTVSTSFVPVCSFRRKNTFDARNISIILEGVSIITNQNMEWAVVVGASLTNASWGTPELRSASETAIEVDSSATSFSGGETIWNQLQSSEGQGDNRIGSTDSSVDIRVPRLQTVTLVARRFSSLSDATVRAVLRAAEEW